MKGDFMPYPIDQKLVVGVSSNALFDLEMEDHIFKEKGIEAYKTYQIQNIDVVLKKGTAFPFVRRFLNINEVLEGRPVEVVLMSKNSPEIGLRILNSIKAYGLDISRAVFTSGRSPYSYIPAYNISLYLSTNKKDVDQAIAMNYPAGVVLDTNVVDDEEDIEFRIAFDFDGVLASDEAEIIYQETKNLDTFHEHEDLHSKEPLKPGLLHNFLQKLSALQEIERQTAEKDDTYKKVLRTSVVTARSAPAHLRAINTLRSWNVSVDEMFFLGGIEKRRILEELKPHLFIDDQIGHLNKEMENIPLVHIPFGVINNPS